MYMTSTVMSMFVRAKGKFLNKIFVSCRMITWLIVMYNVTSVIFIHELLSSVSFDVGGDKI